jgi:hypothetical protein
MYSDKSLSLKYQEFLKKANYFTKSPKKVLETKTEIPLNFSSGTVNNVQIITTYIPATEIQKIAEDEDYGKYILSIYINDLILTASSNKSIHLQDKVSFLNEEPEKLHLKYNHDKVALELSLKIEYST